MAGSFTPAEDYHDGYLDDYEDYEGYGDEAENIEMKNRDDWEQTPDEFAKPPEEETTFDEKLPDAPQTLVSLEKQEKIESYYKYLEDNGYRVDKDAHLKHEALFTMSDNAIKRSPQAEALLAKTCETIASTNSSPERQKTSKCKL